jgi:hypothetical protein
VVIVIRSLEDKIWNFGKLKGHKCEYRKFGGLWYKNLRLEM